MVPKIARWTVLVDLYETANMLLIHLQAKIDILSHNFCEAESDHRIK